MGIGKDITRELENREWSVYRLEHESDSEEGTVGAIIRNDSNPRIDTVIRIADAFGITVDELVKNPKPMPKIRGKPKDIKDLRRCLDELGLGSNDIDDITEDVKRKVARLKEQGRAASQRG